MPTSGGLTVDLADAASSTDAAFVRTLCELVNQVYADSEKGLWRDGAVRTSPEEIVAVIVAGELLVARMTDNDVVGCVRVHDVAADISEFGLLAASPDHQARGVGRALVDEAERRSRDRELAAIQLELLVPRDWEHPSKALLAAWYSRRGYQHVDTVAFDGPYPHLAPLLSTPCELRVYRKSLG